MEQSYATAAAPENPRSISADVRRSQPHFHATYAEHRAEIGIETLAVIQDALPRRALALVLEWAFLHRDELRTNWDSARRGEPLVRIEPLE